MIYRTSDVELRQTDKAHYTGFVDRKFLLVLNTLGISHPPLDTFLGKLAVVFLCILKDLFILGPVHFGDSLGIVHDCLCRAVTVPVVRH